MNLEELKKIIDFTIETLQKHQKPKDISALITLSENSMGARASSEIKYVGMGMDWEHGQLRIEPTIDLVRKRNALNNIKSVIRHEFNSGKFYACPRCILKVAKDDCYCRHCGQRLR